VYFACYRRASKTSRINLFCLLPLRPSTCGAVTAVASILRPPWSMGREVPPASPSPSGSIVGKYSWPPCRAATAGPGRHRAAVPDRAMGQAFGPRRDTWAVYPCRAAHGPRPFSPCRVGPWHNSLDTPEEEGRVERR
jgi:hypothetical protein